MFIAFSLSFVSSPNEKYYSCKIRSHLCMRSSLRDGGGGGEWMDESKARKNSTFSNVRSVRGASEGGGLLKICSSLNQNESTFFTPFLQVFSLRSVLLHGRLLQREFLRCSLLNISFIISPSEPTGAWRKKGTGIECERRTKNLQFKFPI